MSLAGKRALVTAGSRNLGVAVATRLARAGMSVGVNYHTSREAAEDLVARLQRETGGNHVAIAADVTRPDEIRSMVADASGRLGGPIDILVNNAGPFGVTPFAQLTTEEWDRVWDANVKATYLAVQAVVPGMRAAGWGRVVNLSAVSAYVRNRGMYTLAKSAVNTLTEQLALELAPEITVNALAPGQIQESLDDLREFVPEWADRVVRMTPAGRLVRREELAEIVYLLCTPAFDLVTGLTIPVDGGLRLPRF